jgi:hypothetical protein
MGAMESHAGWPQEPDGEGKHEPLTNIEVPGDVYEVCSSWGIQIKEERAEPECPSVKLIVPDSVEVNNRSESAEPEMATGIYVIANRNTTSLRFRRQDEGDRVRVVIEEVRSDEWTPETMRILVLSRSGSQPPTTVEMRKG